MDDRHLPQPGRTRPDHDGNAVALRGCSPIAVPSQPAAPALPNRFEPPASALGPLFRYRLDQIHVCRVNIIVDVNARPTSRVLGGYYRSRRLVRVYSHDRAHGPRPLEELFETFLHEVAHHLEYTEPYKFGARGCHRSYGLMHSRLFWRIFGDLKWRWANRAACHLRRS
jgi:hypothetical protein